MARNPVESLYHSYNQLPRPPEKQSFRNDGATVLKKVKIQKKYNCELRCDTVNVPVMFSKISVKF